MFYVGGNFRNSNVELHDVRFSVGETPEECRVDLRKQWWGDPESLHLDCWGEVEQADGYDVALTRDHGVRHAERLFFVNLGGYDAKEFGELHKNVLLVASDTKAATARALVEINRWALPHKDNVFEVEKAVDVTALMSRYGCVLTLTKASLVKPFRFTCDFVPIA